ncbi:MAG: nickel pincer cofactor biosynthesis protein LarC [Firmicutes bacterium]|nr:nickel pincer cofactor biosynthesis protein LarC [Bacillota bacterium]
MKIAYFECFSGISGDMILGALVDAGLDLGELKTGLDKLKLAGPDAFELKVEKTARNGISGTSIEVITDLNPGHPRAQGFRRLSDIEAVLDASDLDEATMEMSRRIFRRLAVAEAKVHNIPVDQVHFHEVGAVDTIVDVVGAVLGFRAMGVTKIYASRLHVGTGFVKCAHGMLPVPAPATLELLRGVPIYATGVQGELVTPTGAAIITTLAESFGGCPEMHLERIGYGAGKQNLDIPNLLRIYLGEKVKRKRADGSEDRAKGKTGAVEALAEVTGTNDAGYEVIVECNIDDMNPEFYDHVMQVLFEKGALDVFLTPVIMKKERPGTVLTVLTCGEKLDEIARTIMMETTTLGVRIHRVMRRKAERDSISVTTRFGEARVKVARLEGQILNIAPEYEDCRKLARKHGVPLKVVYEEVKRAIQL